MTMTPTTVHGLGLPAPVEASLLSVGFTLLDQLPALIDSAPEYVQSLAGISAADLETLVTRLAGPLTRPCPNALRSTPTRPVAGLIAPEKTDRVMTASPRASGFPTDPQLADWQARIGSLPKQALLVDSLPPVGDQGQNGFCGGFGASVPHMLHTGIDVSEGFLYRGAKTIDRCPDIEGTTIRDTMRFLYGFGHVDKTLYSYQDAIDNRPVDTLHHDARKLRSYGFCSILPAPGASSEWTARFIKAAIAAQINPQFAATAVPFGMQLFESFHSRNTQKEGVMRPHLPSERSLGGHAMAAVGYFEADAPDNPLGISVIVARNSHGEGFAPANIFGLPGHVIIPETMFNRADLLWEAYICLAPRSPRKD